MNCHKNTIIRRTCFLLSLIWLNCSSIYVPASDDIPIDKFLEQKQQEIKNYIVQFTDPPIVEVKQRQMNSETQVSPVDLATKLQKKQTALQNLQNRFLDDLSDHVRSKYDSENGFSTGVDSDSDNDAADKIKRTFSYLFNGAATKLDDEELEFVSNLPYVQKIFPDRPVTLRDTYSDPPFNADYFPQASSATGEGMVIAIIDTGVDYLHPDLGGGIGPLYKVIAGYDFINDDNDPMDDNGHGTHCAGIAAANGVLKGIAPGASILAYKVLNTAGNGIFSDIIAALEKAADPDGDPLTPDAAHVVSISIGGYGNPDDALSMAVDNAVAEGIVCVVAAGNEYNYYSITSPGSARDAITVGASDLDNRIAVFSSRGPTNNIFLPKPDVLAPGVSIYSTLPDGKYGFKSGTSMATPYVAGAAAIVRQVYPFLGPLEIKNLLRETATSIGEDALTQGSGLINLENALDVSAIVSPAVVYLESINDTLPIWQANTTLEIKNITTEPREFFLSWSADMPSGISVSFSSNPVSVSNGSSTAVTVYLTVDTSVLPSLSTLPYIYDGFVVFQDTATLNDYRVQILFNKEQPDPFEPNNNYAEASPTTITSNRQLIHGNGRTKIDPESGLASNPDKDWFAFSGQSGDKITLNIDAQDISSPLNSKLNLYDSGLNIIANNNDYNYHSDPFLRNIALPATGTYYIEVLGENNTTGAYHLITSSKPSNLSWFTDISGLTGMRLLEGGTKLLTIYSNKIQILDNTNYGLQLWQVTSISPVSADASEASNHIAMISKTGSTYQLFSFNSSTSAAQWQYTFPSNHIPSEVVVSRDGSTIAVYSEDSLKKHCIIYIFNRLSSFPEFVYSHQTHNLSNSGFSISADGSLVLFSDLNKTYVLDKTLQTLRWSGEYANRTYTINNDGTYLVGSSKTSLLTLRRWNGKTYEKVWDFNPGNNETIFRTAISGNGQTIVTCQRLIAGFYGLDDYGIEIYVFDKSSNKPLYTYRLLKNRDNTPSDDIFGIPVPNAVDEIVISPDGKNIAVSLWGADPQQPEILFFNPENPQPIADYYALGSVSDISMINDKFCFYSEGKHNFHFFRFFIQQELAGFELSAYLSPVAPFIKDVEHTPSILEPGDTVTISANVTDSDGINGVTASIFYDNDTPVADITMNDSATAPDITASDSIYAGYFTTDSESEYSYYYTIRAQDTLGNISVSNKKYFTTYPSPFISATVVIEGDTSLHPGTKSNISFIIENTGTATLSAGKATVFIQDQYMDDYYIYAIDTPALSVGESATISKNKLYVKPAYTVPHNYTFSASLTIKSNDFETTVSTDLPVTDTLAPYAHNSSVSPKYLSAGETILFKSTIIDGSPITEALMIIKDRSNDTIIDTLPLFDDGLHGDEYENDGIFANSWTTDTTPRDYSIQVYARDALNNSLTYTQKILFTTIPFITQANILLVDDTKNEPGLIDIYKNDLNALSIQFDLWDTPVQDEVPADVLAQYKNGIVIWVVGLTSGNYHVSTEEQDNIMDYLDSGGNLIITGQQLCYYLTLLGKQENTLLKEYLSAKLVLKDTNCVVVRGIPGNLVSDGYWFTLPNQFYTGEIDPISPAASLLRYDVVNGGGVIYSSGSAAVINTTENFRAVLFDLDISGLYNTTDRQEFLNTLINYISSPKIADVAVMPTILQPEQSVQILASVYDVDDIVSVHASILDNSQTTVLDTIQLFDDGAHNDGEPDDHVYGNTYTTSSTPQDYYVTVTAFDTFGNESKSIEPVFFSTMPNPNLAITNVSPYTTDHFAPNSLTYFDISVLNNGTLAVSNLSVVLSLHDPFVQYYLTYERTLPAINVGETQSTTGGKFYIKLSPDAPHNHEITLNFKFTDTSDKEYHASYTITVQDTLPPVVSLFNITPRTVAAGCPITITAKVVDGMDIGAVNAYIYSSDGSKSWSLTLYDDGLHSDSAPNDSLFANVFTTDSLPLSYFINLTISDSLGNTSTIAPIDRFTTIPFIPVNRILIVDDTSSLQDQYHWIADYFATQNYPYDVWKTAERGEVPYSYMQEYISGAVMWCTAKSSTQTISVSEINTLSQFMDEGGNLLFTGEDTAYNINSIHGASFLNNYFNISFLKRDITIKSLVGVAGDTLTDGLSVPLTTNHTPGEISVSSPSLPIFYFDQSSGSGNIIGYGITGARLDAGIYKAVYLDFSWDGIMSSHDRKIFLKRTFEWFGVDQTPILASVDISPSAVEPDDAVLISADVDNPHLIKSIIASIYTGYEQPVATILLFDDGTHGDILASDSIFSRSFLTLSSEKEYFVDIQITKTDDTVLLYHNCGQFSTKQDPLLRYSGFRYKSNTLLEPGKTTYLSPAITNIGRKSAANVKCSISLRDKYISYYRTSALEYGTIAPGAKVYEEYDSFYISLKPECPHNYRFSGIVTITDISGKTTIDTIEFVTTDLTGPVITSITVSPQSTNPGGTTQFYATLTDSSPITSVQARVSTFNDTLIDTVQLSYYPAESRYGSTWQIPSTPEFYKVTILAEDNLGNQSVSSIEQWFNSKPFVKRNPLLVVIPKGLEPHVHPSVNALQSLGYAFDIWDRGLRGDITSYIPTQYTEATIIYCADTLSASNTISTSTQQMLIDHFNNDGNLLLEGANLVYNLTNSGLTANTLINSIFKVDYVSYRMYIDTILGVPGGVYDHDTFTLTGNLAGEITVNDTSARGQLKVKASVNPDQVQQYGYIATSVTGSGNSYRGLLFNFNIADIQYPDTRESVLNKGILWMQNNQSGARVTDFSVSPFIQNPSGVFTFQATIEDTAGVNVALLYIYNESGALVTTIMLYDDGDHGDGDPYDFVYGRQWTAPATPAYYTANLLVQNNDGKEYFFENIFRFSTTAVPWLFYDSAVPTYYGQFLTGITNYFDLYIANNGTATAHDVKVMLSTDDPRITYITGSPPFTYGTIEPSATKKQNGSRYSFRTATNCPNATDIQFTINISSSSYTFTDKFTLTIYDQSAPTISNQKLSPQYPNAGSAVDITANVSDASQISTVWADIELLSGAPVIRVFLYDDGLHNDQNDNDTLYGNSITLPAMQNDYKVRFYAQDILGNGAYSYTELWFSTRPFEQKNNILVVSYHAQNPMLPTPLESTLKRLGYPFDIWRTTLRGDCDSSVLEGYTDGIVIWDTKTAAYSTFSQDTQQIISDYLDNNGNFLLVGEQNVYYISNGGKNINTLLDNYFNVLYIRRSAPQKQLIGKMGDSIGNGVTLDLQYNRAGEIDTEFPAEPVLYLHPDDTSLSTGTAAVKIDTGSYKAVLFDLQFDTIRYTSQQDKLLAQTIAWFNVSTVPRLLACNVYPAATVIGEPVTITAELSDTSYISSATVTLTDNDGIFIETISLYNDATHGDTTANDTIFTKIYTPLIAGTEYTISLHITTTDSKTYSFPDCGAFYTNARPVFVYETFSFQTGSSHFAPGAFTYFGITIRNIGTAGADNVQAVLSILDPYLAYNSTFAVSYGSMSINELKASDTNKYRIQPAYNCPNGYIFTGYLTVTDAQGNQSVDTISLTVTDTTAPYPETVTLSGTYFQVGEFMDIQTLIREGSGVKHVRALIESSGYSYTLPLYDTGNHADGKAGDSIFGNTFIIPFTPRSYTIKIYTEDILSNSNTWNTTKLFTSIPFIPQHRVLLLDDDGGSSNVEQQYKDLLTNLGYEYDYWDCNLRGDIDISTLLQYLDGCVLLFTGTNTATTRISATDQANYIAYLSAGGTMIVSGSDNGYLLTNYGAQSNVFLNDYLHAQYQGRSYNLRDITGVTGELFEGASATLAFAYAAESDPVPPGITALTYSGSSLPYTQSTASAAIKTDTGVYKTMFFDFRFVNINQQLQKEFLMKQTLEWILGPHITNPTISALHRLPGETIDISCAVNDIYLISSVIAQIEQPDETTVAEVILYDDGTGADILENDGIFTGRYTVPAGSFDYLIDLIAYNTNGNFGRLNNALSFSTKNIPYLTVTEFSSSDGSGFQAGKQNFIDIGVRNVGTLASQASTVSISINNTFVEQYHTGLVSYSIINPSVTIYAEPSPFFIEPTIFTNNGQKIQVTITMSGYDGSYNQYTYKETVLITIADNDAPILIYSEVSPQSAQTDSLITITAQIQEGTEVDYIQAVILSNDGIPLDTITLYDDGLHNDNQDNDFIFAGSWLTPSSQANYHITVSTADILGAVNTYSKIMSFTTKTFEQQHAILLVNADRDNDTAVNIMKTILDNTAAYDIWDMKYRGSITENLAQHYQYGAIILITGDNGITCLTAQDYDTLRTYLSTGGNLFISGRNIGYYTETDNEANYFLNQYLYAYSVQKQTGSTYLKSTNSTIGIPDIIDINSTTETGEIDVFTPAYSIFEYDTTLGAGQTFSSKTGGFAVETTIYRAICLDFGIEHIQSEVARSQLVSRSVKWLTDWDNDGLTDAWEFLYFGSRSPQSGSDDPDCDGLTNAQEEAFASNPLLFDTDNDSHSDLWEYIAGTNPNDPASKFVVGEIFLDNDGVTVTWESVPDKSYSIYYCQELPIFTLIDTVTANGPTTSYQDTGTPPDRPNPKDQPMGLYIIYIREE